MVGGILVGRGVGAGVAVSGTDGVDARAATAVVGSGRAAVVAVGARVGATVDISVASSGVESEPHAMTVINRTDTRKKSHFMLSPAKTGPFVYQLPMVHSQSSDLFHQPI